MNFAVSCTVALKMFSQPFKPFTALCVLTYESELNLWGLCYVDDSDDMSRVRTILALGYCLIFASTGLYWVLGNTFLGCGIQYQYHPMSS